jgi:hypothetical protein
MVSAESATWGEYFNAASHDLDRNWLDGYVASNSVSYEQAHYDLIANEVKRRVQTIKAAANARNMNTRVMIYADMFDPQFNGNVPGNSNGANFYAWAREANFSETTVNLTTMKVLLCRDMQAVRNELVLNPWMYSRTTGGDPYDAAAPLTYFRNCGFKVVTGSAYCFPDSWDAMAEWIRVSELPENRATVIGHMALSFHDWINFPLYWNNSPRPPFFNVINDLTDIAPLSPLMTASPDPKLSCMADVNGDKREDIITFRGNGTYVSTANSDGRSYNKWTKWTNLFSLNSGWGTQYPRQVADVNGDGRADIVGFGCDDVWVSLSNGTSFESGQLWSDFYCHNDGWNGNTLKFVKDVDGDKKADLVGFGYYDVWVARSYGSYFGGGELWSQKFRWDDGWTSAMTLNVADMDADGRGDIVGIKTTRVLAAKSNGNAFVEIPLTT